MTAKGIEQLHLFLLYQIVVPNVTGYGLGLTTMSQTNLLYLDRVQNEAMRVMLGTTKNIPTETMVSPIEVHNRPPTIANQTESGVRSKHTSVLSKIPTTHSTLERHKGMQAGTRQALDGSSRGLNTERMPADRAQASQRVGKVPKPIPASLWKNRKTWEITVENGQQVKRSEISSFSFKKTANPRPHSVHWRLSHQRPVRVGLHCQARYDYHPRRQCSI